MGQNCGYIFAPTIPIRGYFQGQLQKSRPWVEYTSFVIHAGLLNLTLFPSPKERERMNYERGLMKPTTTMLARSSSPAPSCGRERSMTWQPPSACSNHGSSNPNTKSAQSSTLPTHPRAAMRNASTGTCGRWCDRMITVWTSACGNGSRRPHCMYRWTFTRAAWRGNLIYCSVRKTTGKAWSNSRRRSANSIRWIL